MNSSKLNPMRTKLLHFKTPSRLSLDEETRPSTTPRSDDPYLEATNPTLHATLIKQLREKDEHIHYETSRLWQTELAYKRELEASENELQHQINVYHERLLDEVRKNTQLQLELEMLEQNSHELTLTRNTPEERSSTLTLLTLVD